jgi:hypothetical protein
MQAAEPGQLTAEQAIIMCDASGIVTGHIDHVSTMYTQVEVSPVAIRKGRCIATSSMVVMLLMLFKRRRERRPPVNHRIADTARCRRDTEKDPPSQARWQARSGHAHHLAPRPQEQRHHGPQLLTASTVPCQVKSARIE